MKDWIKELRGKYAHIPPAQEEKCCSCIEKDEEIKQLKEALQQEVDKSYRLHKIAEAAREYVDAQKTDVYPGNRHIIRERVVKSRNELNRLLREDT